MTRAEYVGWMVGCAQRDLLRNLSPENAFSDEEHHTLVEEVINARRMACVGSDNNDLEAVNRFLAKSL